MPQVVKFLIVGAAGFMVNLGIYAALVAVHAPYALSAAASYLVSNSGMTSPQGRPPPREPPRRPQRPVGAPFRRAVTSIPPLGVNGDKH